MMEMQITKYAFSPTILCRCSWPRMDGRHLTGWQLTGYLHDVSLQTYQLCTVNGCLQLGQAVSSINSRVRILTAAMVSTYP